MYQDQVTRLVTGARELLGELPPATALRTWMDLFGDWIATKNGMLDTLLAMIKSGEITHAQTRAELLSAITESLDAGRATGELRADITAEDIAASLVGIFTVAQPPQYTDRASRLLDILMDGLRPPRSTRSHPSEHRGTSAPVIIRATRRCSASGRGGRRVVREAGR